MLRFVCNICRTKSGSQLSNSVPVRCSGRDIDKNLLAFNIQLEQQKKVEQNISLWQQLIAAIKKS